MRIQRASEGFHYGDIGNHKQAVDNVIQFITEHNPKIVTYRGWWIHYNDQFVRREKIDWTPEHEYDIAIQNGIKMYFIEIDGESHGKKNIRGHEQRKIKDGIAVKHANESGIQVIRLDKTECLGDRSDREIYLMRCLWKYLK